MSQPAENNIRKWVGRFIGLAVFVAAVVVLVQVVEETPKKNLPKS